MAWRRWSTRRSPSGACSVPSWTPPRRSRTPRARSVPS
jgi:hypothetical protein